MGREVSRNYADRAYEVTLSGRDPARAQAVAEDIGGHTHGIGVDLSQPEKIADALSQVTRVDHLVLTAAEPDHNSVRDYDLAKALHLVTAKLVGYTEVAHVLAARMADDGSIVLFGGMAKDRPFPGSTTVTTVNGGITGLVRALAFDLAPVRVNAIHPGVIGDSPHWAGQSQVTEMFRAGTPTVRHAMSCSSTRHVVQLDTSCRASRHGKAGNRDRRVEAWLSTADPVVHMSIIGAVQQPVGPRRWPHVIDREWTPWRVSPRSRRTAPWS